MFDFIFTKEEMISALYDNFRKFKTFFDNNLKLEGGLSLKSVVRVFYYFSLARLLLTFGAFVFLAQYFNNDWFYLIGMVFIMIFFNSYYTDCVDCLIVNEDEKETLIKVLGPIISIYYPLTHFIGQKLLHIVFMTLGLMFIYDLQGWQFAVGSGFIFLTSGWFYFTNVYYKSKIKELNQMYKQSTGFNLFERCLMTYEN